MQEGIAAYWRHRFIEMPALELEDLQVDGGAVVVSYRTSSGIVQALLDIAEDGLITRCRCGPSDGCWASRVRSIVYERTLSSVACLIGQNRQ